MTGLIHKDLLLLAKALRAFALFALVFAVLRFPKTTEKTLVQQ